MRIRVMCCKLIENRILAFVGIKLYCMRAMCHRGACSPDPRKAGS